MLTRRGYPGLLKKLMLLAQKARFNQLTPEEVSGGVFTVSNLGMWGGFFHRHHQSPEAAILACGAIRKKPFSTEKRLFLLTCGVEPLVTIV